MEKLLFKQVKFENWLPFYEKHNLMFSTNEKKRVTLNTGDNQAGKTSILNGIQYCLFGQLKKRGDKTIKRSDAIKFLNTNAKKEENLKYQVELVVQHGETKYKIERSTEFASLDSNPKQKLFVEMDGKAFQDNEAQNLINKFFDSGVARFFLFDGEMLNEYEELIESEISNNKLAESIKKSIEDVLRITTLKQARKTLIDISSIELRKENKKQNAKDTAAATGKKIEELQTHLAELEKEKEKISGELLKFKAEHDKKWNKLQNSNLDKQEKFSELAALVKEYEKSLSEVNKDLLKILPETYKELLRPKKEDISKNLQKELSKYTKKQDKFSENRIIRNILKNDEISEESRKVLIEYIPSIDEDEKESIDNLINEIKRNLKTLDSVGFTGSPLTEAKMKTDKKIDLLTKLAKAESEKMQIERELKKDKSSDDENFASIKKDISKLENKIRERENQMSPDLTDSLVSKINSIEDELKPLRAAESRMTTLKEKFSMYDISSALLNIFEDSIDTMIRDAKENIELNANQIYGEFKKYVDIETPSEITLQINDNFGLQAKTVEGDDRQPSAGGSQIVALSLIAGLRNATGIDAPLIMDSPLMRLDGNNRKAFLEITPKHCSQYVLLVHDGELSTEDPLMDVIRPKCEQINKLRRLNDNETEIEDISL